MKGRSQCAVLAGLAFGAVRTVVPFASGGSTAICTPRGVAARYVAGLSRRWAQGPGDADLAPGF